MNQCYEIGYQLLSLSSNEEGLIADTILGYLPKFNSMADIGSADGRITARLTTECCDLLIVEPNPILFSMAMSRLSKKSPRGINAPFPCDIGMRDLIVASHVLYHIDASRWTETILELSNSLNDFGMLIISLWNKDSEARLLSLRHSGEDRWLCSFEDLYYSFTEIRSIGLTDVRRVEIEPLIKPYSIPAAMKILEFLSGRSIHELEKRDSYIDSKKLVEYGLKNRQTLWFLQKRL